MIPDHIVPTNNIVNEESQVLTQIVRSQINPVISFSS
jgi:hypothetical protein